MAEFTSDWFSHHAPRWQRVLRRYRGYPAAALEIGSFEGRSALFLLTYLSKCRVTCVDTFCGDYDQRFDRNLAAFSERVEKRKARSVQALDALATEGRRFDIIYVDGSHERQDVLADSVLAWPLLNVGGILIWDDYAWERSTLPANLRPEHAIDLFCSVFAPCIRRLHTGAQVIIEKQTEWPAPSIAYSAWASVRHVMRQWWRRVTKTAMPATPPSSRPASAPPRWQGPPSRP